MTDWSRESVESGARFVCRELDVFCLEGGGVGGPVSAEEKVGTYTESTQYLKNTTHYHFDVDMKPFTEEALSGPNVGEIIDVGCCSGLMGLVMALREYWVTFHDFEGVGLAFVRWMIERHGLEGEVIPYGQEVTRRYDTVIATDVLEHTGNHLGFIRWVSGLGKRVIVTYPQIAFSPPHVEVIDEWVDDEVIVRVVEERYEVVTNYLRNGRRFLIWRT